MNRSAQHRSSPSIVFFSLGLASVIDDGSANASLVLALAAELGLPEAACRAAIMRLRREELLVSERVGRSARYSASPAVAATQQRWSDYFRTGPPAWDGRFSGLLYDFAERDRSRRDRFRRAARLIGYGLLRPGLLISPDDRWPQLADPFAADERAGRILRVGLTLAADDAGPVARKLWGLDRLARRYRRIAQDTDRALSGPPPRASAGRSAIARLYTITRPIYAAVADDPALPAQLLPSGWPAHELGAALSAANEALGPAAFARLHELQAGLSGQVGSASPIR